MAYQKPTTAQYKRIGNKYGEDSKEFHALALIEQSRLPLESIAEVLGFNLDDVKADVTGIAPMEPHSHMILINAINSLAADGIKRGLLPSRDLALTTEILRTLVELMTVKHQLQSLQ